MDSLAIDNPVSWDLARTFTGTTPTDGRIEHQIEELVGKLEAHASPSPGSSWCPSFNDGSRGGHDEVRHATQMDFFVR